MPTNSTFRPTLRGDRGEQVVVEAGELAVLEVDVRRGVGERAGPQHAGLEQAVRVGGRVGDGVVAAGGERGRGEDGGGAEGGGAGQGRKESHRCLQGPGGGVGARRRRRARAGEPEWVVREGEWWR